ncbi:MAG: putative phosphohydrolase [Phycisphaerales bacterium]|nr:putative phosphohydrolase [Phycisphaerales bacterium]
MRTLAIGDIHGCSRALDHLLAAARPRSNDVVITLGDYVDRGPDSAGVIERLIRLRETCKLVAIRGNHEQMMLDARKGPDRTVEWVHCGGEATLTSYAPIGGRRTLDNVPAAHWDFLENVCVSMHETDTHFFVHANADPDLPLDDQPEFLLRWETFRDPPPHVSGKIMVCGHTPQKNGLPRNIGHALCIDTRAYRKGWLTCLEVATGYVWQANQDGELRAGWATDFLEEPAGAQAIRTVPTP